MKTITWAGVLLLGFVAIATGEDKPSQVSLRLDATVRVDAKAPAEGLQKQLVDRLGRLPGTTWFYDQREVSVTADGKRYAVRILIATRLPSTSVAMTFVRDVLSLLPPAPDLSIQVSLDASLD